MKEYIDTGKKDTRSGFGAGLAELGKNNPNVVALCADLTGSLKMDEFKANHPERFFQVVIAQANMLRLTARFTTKSDKAWPTVIKMSRSVLPMRGLLWEKMEQPIKF